MNKSISKIMIALAILVPGIAHSSCGTQSCSNVTIENIYTTADGNVLIMTSGDETTLGCTQTSGKYVTLDTTSPNSNLIYSGLLASRMANREVKIVIQSSSVSGSAICRISRVEF